ncbi:MAG: hypothetical protein H7335_01130 [Massilia sp.]|nr:hypothetical protein [Massilia sp.]
MQNAIVWRVLTANWISAGLFIGHLLARAGFATHALRELLISQNKADIIVGSIEKNVQPLQFPKDYHGAARYKSHTGSNPMSIVLEIK